MSWIYWAIIALLAVNALFFGVLLAIHAIEERERRK